MTAHALLLLLLQHHHHHLTKTQLSTVQNTQGAIFSPPKNEIDHLLQ